MTVGKSSVTFFARTPHASVPCQMQDFGGIQERLAGHATAQDAQTADFRTAFDHDGFQTLAQRGSRGGITGAATTQNRDGAIKCSHDNRMRDFRPA